MEASAIRSVYLTALCALLFAVGVKDAPVTLLCYVARNNHDNAPLLEEVQKIFDRARMGDEGIELIKASRQEAADMMNKGVLLWNLALDENHGPHLGAVELAVHEGIVHQLPEAPRAAGHPPHQLRGQGRRRDGDQRGGDGGGRPRGGRRLQRGRAVGLAVAPCRVLKHLVALRTSAGLCTE